MSSQKFLVSNEQQGKTLAAALRLQFSGRSWSEVRRWIELRRVKIGTDLCLDEARRLKEGETVELLERPAPKPIANDGIVIRYADAHVVVVEKPAGICTVRHPADRDWSERRKALSPTLEDLVQKKLSRQERGKTQAHLRIVHRLDKETSGLLVVARTVAAERGLGKQFHAHTVHRRYLAVVPGFLPAQRIDSELIRDRGDGRRGSARVAGQGRRAITHIEVAERLAGYTLLWCRLETGRTHQIRIHLAEAGHPVCGDSVYGKTDLKSVPQRQAPEAKVSRDASGAPRLALHAAELGFTHPATGENLRFSMPLPPDLATFVESLRAKR
jgi:23S rRNA pseudouridine1911/1915/1917 synthase